MGINGLLPFLKSIQRPTHIKNWKDQTVAVDAYGWLHRGTISCAVDLALEKPTTRYVDYAMHRVRMLQHYGVTPYLVFDGDYLPGKKGTELDRQKRRTSSRETGLELLRLGRTSQAHAELQKSIDVTPLMARHLIEELKKANIPYVVAPYEADAQMAYLERIGEVSAILSEDSDLLVFGAKCLLTKLGQYGECIAIHRSDLPKVSEANMAGWSDSEFCRMAILSGCDYLLNIPKMGIKTAYKFVRKYKSVDKIIRAIRMDGSFAVPTSYEKSFVIAEMTFRYQRVYCPKSCRLVSCNGDIALPNDVGDEDALNFGDIYDPKIASQVASGDLDPITKLHIRPAILSASTSLKQKSRITNFFAPRTALAELGSCNALTMRQESVTLNPAGVNSRTPMRGRVPLGTGNKKRRLCMDEDNDIAPNAEHSPFFAKPSKHVRKLPRHSIAPHQNPIGCQKNGVGYSLGQPNCRTKSAEQDASEMTGPRDEVSLKARSVLGSDQAPHLRTTSLASFRFQPCTVPSGKQGSSISDSQDKENYSQLCSD
ncbi:Rad2 nuclease [Arthrobotrys megalospora]